jgi:hypothetical protein
VVNFTPRPLYPRGKSPATHWIGRWVDLRAGLEDLENRKLLTLPGLELRLLGRPARSQPLYRLRYPGSYKNSYTMGIIGYFIIGYVFYCFGVMYYCMFAFYCIVLFTFYCIVFTFYCIMYVLFYVCVLLYCVVLLYVGLLPPSANPFAVNNNSIQFFIYLRAELNSRGPITESGRNMKTNNNTTTKQNTHKEDKTKNT